MSALITDPGLTLIWAGLLAFAVFAYIVMDGFDLGVGILFPLLKDGEEKDGAMNSIAPVWDGNETWLVLGGGGLMAAFPLAYAIILPALYAPIVAMLLGLVFRGVAFEFRWRNVRHRKLWDFGFTAGSLVAALAQGITVGALLQGIEVEGRQYAGGWWDWLTPFSLLTGLSVAAGYALLGATWLIMKSEGPLRGIAYRVAGPLKYAVFAALVAVSLWTPFLSENYFARWFSWPSILWVAPVPILCAVIFWVMRRDLGRRRHERRPFLMVLGLFFLAFTGLGINIYPDIVPGAVTLAEAAAPRKSQVFMLVGAAVLIPIILAYTAFSYWVFRGKTGHEGYH